MLDSIMSRSNGDRTDSLKSVLEVSMKVDHPSNAFNLHSCLKQLDMPERDSCWTQEINWLFQNKCSQIDEIVSWALSLRSQGADIDIKRLELASVILTWFLSSSHKILRDRATKALTNLFLVNSDIFTFILEKMHDCNDPYVIERLYASAFGACCIDSNPERLKVYSSAVFAKVFANGHPPVALLTRDYALGIIELAESKKVLSGSVSLDDCRHPFESDAPVLDLTTQEVEDIADERSGKEIFSSASSEWGDFGKYTIPRRVRDFLVTPLSQPKPISKGGVRPEIIDLQQCRLWITKRAYELGWKSELFPKDKDNMFGFRQQDNFERIGKKYQHIALDEIQARLADNYWTLQNWHEEPCVYRYSHDNFRRNLEPTILPTNEGYAKLDYHRKGWIIEPTIKLPEITETDMKKWLFEENLAKSILDKLPRIDENGKRWLTLYEHNAKRQRYKKPHDEHGMRYEEFRLLYCVFLRRGKTGEMTKFLNNERKLDVSSFEPRDFTDGPYLREAHWRDTWKSIKFSEYLSRSPDMCDFAIPTALYYWEGHLDKTLPEGFFNCMPQKWFAEELGLSHQGFHSWVNQDGEVLIQTYIHIDEALEHQTAVVINEESLFAYSKEFEVEPIWLMVAERNTCPERIASKACWMRTEGVAWHDGESWKKFNWIRDTSAKSNNSR